MVNGPELTASREDIIMMAKQLKQKVSIWSEQMFVDEEALATPNNQAILEALVRRFPHVPLDQVKVAACRVAATREEGIWKDLIKKIHLENENQNPDAVYKRFRYNTSEPVDILDEHAVHHMRAAYQFTMKVMKWAVYSSPGLPVSMRKIAAPGGAIASIDYISNPQLEKQFLEQKYRFILAGKDAREELLFHGTAAASVEGILRTNFLVEHEPAVVAGQAARAKRMVFGPGIYLSALPAVSLMYGNSLVLCRVLPGTCWELVPGGRLVEEDSGRLVREGEVLVLVARRPEQVLPYCIIHLRPGVLSSQFHKPTAQKATPQVASNAGGPPQDSTITNAGETKTST